MHHLVPMKKATILIPSVNLFICYFILVIMNDALIAVSTLLTAFVATLVDAMNDNPASHLGPDLSAPGTGAGKADQILLVLFLKESLKLETLEFGLQ